MDLVACLDRNYVMPIGVMMYSVCVNNQDTYITFHLVVDESVTEKDKNDLSETVSAFCGKSVLFYHIRSGDYKSLPILKETRLFHPGNILQTCLIRDFT